MKTQINNIVIELTRGDIAAQKDADAVVNAANAQLSGGGGVDGALHRAAGPELKKASQPLGPIKPGEAVITEAFNLPNRFVVHCLGPVYGQDKPENELLSNCYKNALKLAEEKEIEKIAFPSISTGAFGYPMDKAAKVALTTLKEESNRLKSVRFIRMVLWGEEALAVYKEAMKSIFKATE
ncbi:MAG TPA: macro domain-containing protein [Balneolaceae bacterium]|nr:macro domain-containing protein [Balneolaceae bacterium]